MSEPWNSEVIRSGGREKIGCQPDAKEGGKIHVVVYSVSTGKILLVEDLDSEITQCHMNSTEKFITYPASPKSDR